jgi:hypothetical protein
LDAYEDAWEGLKRYDAKPLLVWLTLGSEYWQSEMIKAMRKRGLDGYLTTPERLFLEHSSSYWRVAPVLLRGAPVEELHKMIGGYAPYRKIWLSTEGNRFDLVDFLGISVQDRTYKTAKDEDLGHAVTKGSARAMGAKSFKKGRPSDYRPPRFNDGNYDRTLWD